VFVGSLPGRQTSFSPGAALHVGSEPWYLPATKRNNEEFLSGCHKEIQMHNLSINHRLIRISVLRKGNPELKLIKHHAIPTCGEMRYSTHY
jgi:hypothetical protein